MLEENEDDEFFRSSLRNSVKASIVEKVPHARKPSKI